MLAEFSFVHCFVLLHYNLPTAAQRELDERDAKIRDLTAENTRVINQILQEKQLVGDLLNENAALDQKLKAQIAASAYGVPLRQPEVDEVGSYFLAGVTDVIPRPTLYSHACSSIPDILIISRPIALIPVSLSSDRS